MAKIISIDEHFQPFLKRQRLPSSRCIRSAKPKIIQSRSVAHERSRYSNKTRRKRLRPSPAIRVTMGAGVH